MTVSNYSISRVPWNNPFNSRIHGNYNPDNMYIDHNNLHVPRNTSMFMNGYQQQTQNELHVPCQNQVPMGCENRFAMINSDDFMELPDGTVVDMKKRKIVHKPSESFRMNNPFQGTGTPEWSDNPLEGMVMQNNKDVEYQRECARKDAEIKSNLSPERKELMKELMSGELIGDVDVDF